MEHIFKVVELLPDIRKENATPQAKAASPTGEVYDVAKLITLYLPFQACGSDREPAKWMRIGRFCIFLPFHLIFSILSKKPLSLAVIKEWWGQTKISKPILHTHFESPLFYQLPDKFLAFAFNDLMKLQLSGTKLRFVILFFHF